LEQALAKVLQEQEIDNQKNRIDANEKFERAQISINDLSAKLTKAIAETKHTKKLAQRVLDQRTELEEFFLESLEFVRNQIKKEKEMGLKETQKDYLKNMKEVPLT
jgi:hypothetical protein